MTNAKVPLTDLDLNVLVADCSLSCASSCGSEPSAKTVQKEDSWKKDGWIARSTIDEPRLSEIAQTYRDIGYEVKIAYSDATPLGPDCTICFDQPNGGETDKRWGTVYVRK